MKRLLRRWEDYWFQPGPLLDLGVCRILIVGCQLVVLHFMFPPRMNRLLGGLPDELYDPLPLLHLLILPFGWNARPSAELNEIIRWATSGIGVLALIGFLTRPALIGFALGNAYLIAFKYSFSEVHHAEALPAIALAVLALSPAGAALSVDDLRLRTGQAMRKRAFNAFHVDEESSTFARWPLLLLQWMMAAVYLSAAVSKLAYSGLEWMNGYTLQFYLLQEGWRWDKSAGIWLSRYHAPAVFLSWITVIFESTFFLVLIKPRLAWVYLPLGVLLHVGMDVTLKAFFLQYFSIYAVFVPWTALLRRLSWRRRSLQVKPEVLFDEECPLCIRSMTVVRYADWFDRLKFGELGPRWPEVASRYPGLSRDDCRRRMHVLLPDGSVARGFFAFRRLLPYLPPLWPLLAVFHFPLASRIGPRIYDFVALRRGSFLQCEAESCAVTPGAKE